MPDPILQTIGLTKVFKDFWGREKVRAVDDLNLDIMPGEVFGLLGPNGSGKSTTLKLILGLLFPTKGRVAVFGKRPRDIEVKRRIGFLPEETYLYPYLDAEETLDFYGRIFEIPSFERKRRIEALIKMVGLTGARTRQLGEYSKGMARRIGIAQALVGDPDLVLLDEPTAALDPIGAGEIKDVVRELKSRGKTILLCSHLLADVEDVCDRIAILYAGRLRALGAVDELLARQSVTQISVTGLAPETLAAVREMVRERGKDIQVGHPRDRLEDFFLRVVEQAHAEKPTTTGAAFGDVKADIYAQPKPAEAKADAVVERLVAAGEQTQQPPAEPEPARPQPEPEPRRDVLEKLERAEPAPAAPAPPPPRPEHEKSDDEAKQVIDRLVGKTPAEEGEDS